MPHIIVDNNEAAVWRVQTKTVEHKECVATDEPGDYQRLGPLAAKLLDSGGSVAVIGLGLGVLPRLICSRCAVAAFEIEPELSVHFRARHPWAKIETFIGDYAEMVPKVGRKYDAIVYDLGGPAPDWLSEYGPVIVP